MATLSRACSPRGWLFSKERSAPSSSFPCRSMSFRRLSPKELMATKAAIPITIDEMNSSSLERFFRKSRKAMVNVQEKLCIGSLLYFSAFDLDDSVGPCGQGIVMGHQDQSGALGLI